MTLSETSYQRVEVHEYPQAVIRELGVNMIAHRDYANYLSSCQVQKFKNRISWVSPGGLPPGMTVENILTAQASRNPNILSVLYEAGYVEAFGQGLDTVVRVLTEEEMAPPHFQDTGVSFMVTVYGRPLELMQPQNETYGSLTDAQRMILTLIRSKGEVPHRDIRPDAVRRCGLKHGAWRERITDAPCRRCRAGTIARAVLAAVSGPADRAEGCAARRTRTTPRRQGGSDHSCPPSSPPALDQRSAVRLPLAQHTNTHRCHQQRADQRTAADQPEMCDCPRATHDRNNAGAWSCTGAGLDSQAHIRRLTNRT